MRGGRKMNTWSTFITTHLDFEGVAKSIVVICKNHESAVGAEDQEAPDAENVQPNGPILRRLDNKVGDN